MNATEVVAVLSTHEADLKRRGVRRVGVFGSVARGEASSDSDIDILIDLDSDQAFDVFDFVSLQQFIGSLFPVRVDVVDAAALKPALQTAVQRDTVYAF